MARPNKATIATRQQPGVKSAAAGIHRRLCRAGPFKACPADSRHHMSEGFTIGLLCLAALAAAPATGVRGGDDYMIKAIVKGEFVEGQPLSWSERKVFLLARDGQLISFNPAEATDYRKSSPRLYAYSTGEIRGKLYREFGSRFDVTGTGHYLVVHPAGQRDMWADRFEKMYRSFYHYFQVRGFKMKEPDFPLIAIVFHNRQDYLQYASRTGSGGGATTLGHYDDWTNRIALFDVTTGKSSRDWSQNAETIIHEATHQTAFNTGVHRRFAGVPRWLCEGLATMFEARGVWDSMSFRTVRDRLNTEQLELFRSYRDARRQDGSLAEFLASDRAFRADETGAYAESWALSFYLSETMPRRYSKYLALTAGRPAFQEYTSEERVADFQKVFGDNLAMLEIKFLRYIDRLN